MATSKPLFPLRPQPHPADVPSKNPSAPSLDRLPLELVELVCSWIHADRNPILKRVDPPRRNRWGISPFAECTQFSRTFAHLSLASKRYRRITLPYLYAYITVGEFDTTQLPVFVGVLCRNPDLRALVREIEVQCMPNIFNIDSFDINSEVTGPIFNDAAAQFSLPPRSWSRQCTPCYAACSHCKRLLTLLLLLTPGLSSFSMRSPKHFYLTDLADVTLKRTAISPSTPPVLPSLQHLWMPETQDIARQTSAWLVPSLRTLRLRNAYLFDALPVGVRLECLREITLDVALLTTRGLFSLTSVCRALENFHFYSRGSNWIFPDGHELDNSIGNHREFKPEDIVPAFAHLSGTLRSLAINRWDGVRGAADPTADRDIAFTIENAKHYATWPEMIGNGKLIGSLKNFTALETLKLDSTCLFHRPDGVLSPPALPTDHLTKRLPHPLCHLALPGAPPQMVPALHALASSAASGEFPALKLVEVTSDEKDVRKRQISLRTWRGFNSLTDSYTRFVSGEDWDSLEQAFAAAGVRLVHIDSGNTSCFARDALVDAGLLESEEKQGGQT